MIAVEHLTKRFGRNLVLDDISETICEGEKVVVIGPSGSGKSTFLRCLNLLEQPTKGTITFDGTVITDPKGEYRRHPPPDGHGLPALQPLPQHDHPQEHHPGPGQDQAHGAVGGRRAGPLPAEAGQSGGQGGRLSQPALRRPEAAHRHCAGPGHEAQGHAL